MEALCKLDKIRGRVKPEGTKASWWCLTRSESKHPTRGLGSRLLDVTSNMYNNITTHLPAKTRLYCRESAWVFMGLVTMNKHVRLHEPAKAPLYGFHWRNL